MHESSENLRPQLGDQGKKCRTRASSQNLRLQLAAAGYRKPEPPWKLFCPLMALPTCVS